MVAKDAPVLVRLRLQRREVDRPGDHLMEGPAHQVRLAVEQGEQTLHLRLIPEGGAVAAVQIPNLLEREIGQG